MCSGNADSVSNSLQQKEGKCVTNRPPKISKLHLITLITTFTLCVIAILKWLTSPYCFQLHIFYCFHSHLQSNKQTLSSRMTELASDY